MKGHSIAFVALALAASTFAQVSEQSDGQPTETPVPPPETTVYPETTPVETPEYTPYTITEADHTETVTLPYAPIPTSGWTSTVITEADHTETVPIPIGPTAPTGPTPTPWWTTPYAESSPFIPPNPPVPSTGFTSVVISEGGATETVPVPETSPYVPPETTPEYTVTPVVTPTPETSAPAETTPVPYQGGAAIQTAGLGALAGALGLMVAIL